MKHKMHDNSITIRAVLHKKSRLLYTNHDFFMSPILYNYDEDSKILTFTHPNIDYRKKLIAIRRLGYAYEFNIPIELPLGKFEIDPDSTEDKLIIYLI